jgi:hypothetical protein
MTRQNVAILSSLLLLFSTRAHSHTNSPAAKKKCYHQYRQPPTHRTKVRSSTIRFSSIAHRISWAVSSNKLWPVDNRIKIFFGLVPYSLDETFTGKGGEKIGGFGYLCSSPPPPRCSRNLPLFWPAERGAICT